MRWGIIYSMIFGIKGMFLWLMNLKQQGFNQRMLFSAIYSAQQNNEGLKTQVIPNAIMKSSDAKDSFAD
jgi:hypothetical protein